MSESFVSPIAGRGGLHFMMRLIAVSVRRLIECVRAYRLDFFIFSKLPARDATRVRIYIYFRTHV